jgi:hypothetical protein
MVCRPSMFQETTVSSSADFGRCIEPDVGGLTWQDLRAQD